MNGVEAGSCGSCPEVMHCLDLLEDMGLASESVVNVAFDPMVEELTNDVFQLLQETGLMAALEEANEESPEAPTDLFVAIRQQMAKHLDRIDEHKNDVRDMIKSVTTGCEGPLKMRAAIAGRVVTATLCASPTRNNGFSCEDVHVQRDDVYPAGRCDTT